MSAQSSSTSPVPRSILVPLILVTSLFALWGFANDITYPMVAAFKNIMLISNFQSSLVQFAFYGGYCVMAIPAAIFIQKFSYKQGLLMVLFLYALGCLLFIPSGMMMQFWAFLLSYFIMTCGLSFLETSADPYILALGPEKTATRRLNFAQAFNPLGSITGMFVASNLILSNLNPATVARKLASLVMPLFLSLGRAFGWCAMKSSRESMAKKVDSRDESKDSPGEWRESCGAFRASRNYRKASRRPPGADLVNHTLGHSRPPALAKPA